MLKVLVIDDDVFTRKGIQTMMPWEKHGMEIVGEAANGQSALRFLETHEADLALVDIDMPVMDGPSFIRAASALYPELNYVVLTMHTEFEYVQDVLRLGAIDYIAKMQFDEENFDEILDRIQAGIAKKASPRHSSSIKWREAKILYPEIYALVTIESESDEHIFRFWEKNGLEGRSDVYELGAGVWVFSDSRRIFEFPEPFPNTMLLCVSDVREMTYQQLGRILKNYLNEQFFYEYQPVCQINYKHAYELQEQGVLAGEEALERLKEEWASLNWVHENELFRQFRLDLRNCKLRSSKLYHFLLLLETVWNASYSQKAGERLTLPSVFHNWNEVEEWLMQAYEKANLFHPASKYSEEVTKNIWHAKQYVDTHYASPIDVLQAARQASMSSGYFSRCFHDIVGETFTDYCIKIRISRAQDLLRGAHLSIQQVAFEVGYDDEKYFSRVFKKVTGMAPTDFRKMQNANK